MCEELSELKKKFIISEEEKVEELREILSRIINYAKVCKSGEVLIECKEIPKSLKVLLVIIARYVAGILEEGIPTEVSLEEIASFVGVSSKEASARVSEYIRKGFVKRVDKGVFRARSISSVREALNFIEERVKR